MNTLKMNCDYEIDGSKMERLNGIDEALDSTGAKVGQRVYVRYFGSMIEARYIRLDGRKGYTDQDGNLRHWYQEAALVQG